MSPLIRALILLGKGPTLMTSFNLSYFLRGLIPKYGHLAGELGLQHMNLWGTEILGPSHSKGVLEVI